MNRDKAALAGVGLGLLASALALAYAFVVDLIGLPPTPGVPYGTILAVAAVAVVPFAVAGGSAYVAARHGVFAPLVLVAVLALAPAVLGWTGDELLVGLFVVGPFVVVAGLADALVRARVDRLKNPPSEAGYRALSVGVMAAIVYFGVFTLRAVLPLWRIDTGAPQTLPPSVDLLLMLWYVFGIALVLVGLPVALNRRFGLVAPLFGLAAYLLVDLAYLQPLVAEGAELVVVLLLAVWPLLASVLGGVGAIEWWVRKRRGEYEQPDEEGGEGGDGGDGGGRFTVEGGLFGDRV
ncbi:hypothetical protein HWV23_09895 [Natronomonas halophila]|uniref:hypothetical protein n=1 Tax=Natronomonas halophila TaxID=2747817 RepID=UPI0015B41E9A|nr:hypothetical protein [Natronomonas halophila]QLD86026.1 hypothetical protein HWV23_09895 [Natronomonas halophila]